MKHAPIGSWEFKSKTPAELRRELEKIHQTLLATACLRCGTAHLPGALDDPYYCEECRPRSESIPDTIVEGA